MSNFLFVYKVLELWGNISGEYMNRFKTFLATSALSIGVFIGVGALQPGRVEALAANPVAAPQVSFTFDDGPVSNITNVAPVLAQYGYTGTAYITTSCVGKTTVPNTCAADNNVKYMTWAQIKALQNTYGWEIGSHSVTHPLMSTINASKLENEVAKSKAALQAQGFNPTSFATPYGDYNDKVIAAIAKYYTNHRPFHDTGYNTWPYNNYLLRVQQVQYGVSVDTIKSYIDAAKANNTWLVLVFHDVQPNPSTDPEDYQYSAADLSAIAAYVKSQNIKVTNVSNGLVNAPAADNLLSAPDQTAGSTLSGGWTTDTTTNVTVDATSKGSAPEAVKSVAVTASTTKPVHVFSSKVTVNPTSTYVVKGYINIASKTAGEVGFYIDEYDAAGNWISGQYKQTVAELYIKDISFVYTASSLAVAQARLQIIVSQASGIKMYIDNINWFVTTAGSGNPTPPPTPTTTNVLTNSQFDQGLTGWRTDNASAIVVDNTGMGSGTSTSTSVKLVSPASGLRNAHLFSDLVSVSSAKQYTGSAYVNIAQLGTGEVGFYIDEYDAAGNWISGKYVYGKRTAGAENITFSYTPSSTSVAKASVQIIITAGTNTTAYVDNVQLTTS